MKNFKKCISLFIYGLCGLIVVSCLPYRFCQINPSSQNPLALSLDLPEKVVCLKGKLILKLFPGPPEYYSVEDGDRADYCWILKLDETSFLKAITTPVAEPANILDNIKKRPGADEILLVLDEHMKDFCQKNQSQEIVSEGYLFHAHTAHHYTPILMDVKELKIVGTQMGRQEVYPDSPKCVNFDPCKRNPKVWIPSGREVGTVMEF